MALVKNGLVVDDLWESLDGREPDTIDAKTALLVSPAELSALGQRLSRFGQLGVALAPADDVRPLAEDLKRLALVALTLPKFNDGRAFSQARLVREADGFKGEIRATGHILRDQLNFLRRSGVDTIEVPDDGDVDSWARAWDAEARRFRGYYQTAVDHHSNRASSTPPSVLRRWTAPTAVSVLATNAIVIQDATSYAGAWAY